MTTTRQLPASLTRDQVNALLLKRGHYTPSQPHLFPSLSDQGWDFKSSSPAIVPVVTTPDGESFVGTPNEDGILWVAGMAIVVEGGNEREARECSISFITGAKSEHRYTRGFRVARGYGQTPVLMAV